MLGLTEWDLIDLLTYPGAWTRDAACALEDHARLDPIAGGRPTAADVEAYTAAARELCAHCPVIADCAAEADRNLEVGVWGGALRWRDNHDGGDHGPYVVERLIDQAPTSVHGRTLVSGGVR